MRPCVENELLHQGVAQSHHRGAFVLTFDLQRVERFADVADKREIVNRRRAGFGSTSTSHAAHISSQNAAFPPSGCPGSYALRLRRRRSLRRESARSTPSEAPRETFAGSAKALRHSRRLDVRLRVPQLLMSHASMIALPMKTVERLADVEESNGHDRGIAHDDGDAIRRQRPARARRSA